MLSYHGIQRREGLERHMGHLKGTCSHILNFELSQFIHPPTSNSEKRKKLYSYFPCERVKFFPRCERIEFFPCCHTFDFSTYSKDTDLSTYWRISPFHVLSTSVFHVSMPPLFGQRRTATPLQEQHREFSPFSSFNEEEEPRSSGGGGGGGGGGGRGQMTRGRGHHLGSPLPPR